MVPFRLGPSQSTVKDRKQSVCSNPLHVLGRADSGLDIISGKHRRTDRFVLRQTDFDAQPYSLLGGLLSVQDEVVLDFKLVGTCRLDTSRNC
jgi:hypothetical protein